MKPASHDLVANMGSFIDDQYTLAEMALSKEIAELTEADRFAIAFAAGVHFDVVSEVEDGVARLVFTAPNVGISKIDGRFVVAQRQRSQE